MTEAVPNFESLLREALLPVEPPEDLTLRLESTLQNITELAADELQEWELSAMRDPRNWVRPAAAVVTGGAAGTALVLLRARRRAHVDVSHRGVLGGTRQTAERALKDVRRETRRLFGGR
jgi:hypothetical protein